MVYSDHQALKRSFAIHDVRGRFVLRLHFLEEYKFEIRHWACPNNSTADSLRRSTGKEVICEDVDGVTDIEHVFYKGQSVANVLLVREYGRRRN